VRCPLALVPDRPLDFFAASRFWGGGFTDGGPMATTGTDTGEEFPAGTVCRLRSGGPTMSSAGRETDPFAGEGYRCHWIDRAGAPRSAVYPASVLMPCDPA